MSYDEATYRLIAAYLEGNLSDTERDSFELRMADDSAFAEAVALEKDVHRAILYDGRRALKDTLRQIDAETPSPGKPKPRLAWWKVAASIAIILVPLMIWWSLESSTSPASLFKQSLSDYTPNGFRSEGDALLGNAMRSWQKEDFTTAQASLDQLIESDEADPALWEFRGIIALELNNWQTAESYLQRSLELNANQMSSQYYLALALYKQGKSGEAQSLLQVIVSKGGSYAEKAQAFLDSLD